MFLPSYRRVHFNVRPNSLLPPHSGDRPPGRPGQRLQRQGPWPLASVSMGSARLLMFRISQPQGSFGSNQLNPSTRVCSTSIMERKALAARLCRPSRWSAGRCGLFALVSAGCWLTFPGWGSGVATVWGASHPSMGCSRAGCPICLSKISRHVREPRRRAPNPPNPERDARVLTSRIKKTSSASET